MRAAPRYVRNRCPRAITIWVCGSRLRLEARGSPGDVLALPGRSFEDPDLAGYLDFGWIEEVDADEFVTRFA